MKCFEPFCQQLKLRRLHISNPQVASGCKSSIAEIRREPQSDAEIEQGNKEPLKLVLIY
jgi:hypothetical protein